MPGYMTGSADLGFRMFPRHRLAVILLGVIVIVALWFVVERSTFGIKVRAAVDDPAIAQAIGIDTSRIHIIAFAAGAALAALGGIAGAELLPMESNYAGKYLVVILAVVAVGGHGTIFGSFIAALLLGLVETAAKYTVPDLSSIAFFLTMFAVLLLRPQGLMGRGAH
jgi:branched-chain amino acid transport system permease protein